MARKRRRRSSPRRRSSGRRRSRRGGGGSSLSERDVLVALAGAVGYGFLVKHVEENPQSSVSTFLTKVPQVPPLGRTIVLGAGLYALGKYAKLAPRYTKPVGVAILAHGLVNGGRRGFASDKLVDVLGGDDDQPQISAGEIGADDFLEGDEYEDAEEVAGDDEFIGDDGSDGNGVVELQ